MCWDGKKYFWKLVFCVYRTHKISPNCFASTPAVFRGQRSSRLVVPASSSSPTGISNYFFPSRERRVASASDLFLRSPLSSEPLIPRPHCHCLWLWQPDPPPLPIWEPSSPRLSQGGGGGAWIPPRRWPPSSGDRRTCTTTTTSPLPPAVIPTSRPPPPPSSPPPPPPPAPGAAAPAAAAAGGRGAKPRRRRPRRSRPSSPPRPGPPPVAVRQAAGTRYACLLQSTNPPFLPRRIGSLCVWSVSRWWALGFWV